MNLFFASTKHAAEDRFTAHWVSLLNLAPEIGQGAVDRISSLARIPKAKFLSAEDHPRLGGSNRPDCRIRTDRYDLYCEHKLSALLGERQLERYSATVPSDSYLILVSGDRCRLAPEMLRVKRYVYPSQGEREPHFLWSDFYEVVTASKKLLARHFAECMHVLGMNPTFWGRIGDPFVDAKAADAFRSLYDTIIPALRESGASTMRRSDSLGLQIKNVHPQVPLIYVTPRTSPDYCDVPFTGRLLGASVWVGRKGRRFLPVRSGFVPRTKRRLYAHSWSIRSEANWRAGLYAERDYFLPLPEVLIEDLETATGRMHGWIERIVDHVNRGKDGKLDEWIDGDE